MEKKEIVEPRKIMTESSTKKKQKVSPDFKQITTDFENILYRFPLIKWILKHNSVYVYGGFPLWYIDFRNIYGRRPHFHETLWYLERSDIDIAITVEEDEYSIIAELAKQVYELGGYIEYMQLGYDGKLRKCKKSKKTDESKTNSVNNSNRDNTFQINLDPDKYKFIPGNYCVWIPANCIDNVDSSSRGFIRYEIGCYKKQISLTHMRDYTVNQVYYSEGNMIIEFPGDIKARSIHIFQSDNLGILLKRIWRARKLYQKGFRVTHIFGKQAFLSCMKQIKIAETRRIKKGKKVKKNIKNSYICVSDMSRPSKRAGKDGIPITGHKYIPLRVKYIEQDAIIKKLIAECTYIQF